MVSAGWAWAYLPSATSMLTPRDGRQRAASAFTRIAASHHGSGGPRLGPVGKCNVSRHWLVNANMASLTTIRRCPWKAIYREAGAGVMFTLPQAGSSNAR